MPSGLQDTSDSDYLHNDPRGTAGPGRLTDHDGLSLPEVFAEKLLQLAEHTYLMAGECVVDADRAEARLRVRSSRDHIIFPVDRHF